MKSRESQDEEERRSSEEAPQAQPHENATAGKENEVEEAFDPYFQPVEDNDELALDTVLLPPSDEGLGWGSDLYFRDEEIGETLDDQLNDSEARMSEDLHKQDPQLHQIPQENQENPLQGVTDKVNTREKLQNLIEVAKKAKRGRKSRARGVRRTRPAHELSKAWKCPSCGAAYSHKTSLETHLNKSSSKCKGNATISISREDLFGEIKHPGACDPSGKCEACTKAIEEKGKEREIEEEIAERDRSEAEARRVPTIIEDAEEEDESGGETNGHHGEDGAAGNQQQGQTREAERTQDEKKKRPSYDPSTPLSRYYFPNPNTRSRVMKESKRKRSSLPKRKDNINQKYSISIEEVSGGKDEGGSKDNDTW